MARQADNRNDHKGERIGFGLCIAALTAFLCSDAGGFINGQMIASNGGAQT